jgi:hypothetical protein
MAKTLIYFSYFCYSVRYTKVLVCENTIRQFYRQINSLPFRIGFEVQATSKPFALHEKVHRSRRTFLMIDTAKPLPTDS